MTTNAPNIADPAGTLNTDSDADPETHNPLTTAAPLADEILEAEDEDHLPRLLEYLIKRLDMKETDSSQPVVFSPFEIGHTFGWSDDVTDEKFSYLKAMGMAAPLKAGSQWTLRMDKGQLRREIDHYNRLPKPQDDDAEPEIAEEPIADTDNDGEASEAEADQDDADDELSARTGKSRRQPRKLTKKLKSKTKQTSRRSAPTLPAVDPPEADGEATDGAAEEDQGAEHTEAAEVAPVEPELVEADAGEEGHHAGEVGVPGGNGQEGQTAADIQDADTQEAGAEAPALAPEGAPEGAEAETPPTPTLAPRIDLRLPWRDQHPEEEELPLDDIAVEPDLQSRDALDPEVIKEYAALMTSGVRFAPITVFRDQDQQKYWLADGFLRVAAARTAKQETMPATIYTGTRQDALLYSLGANGKHGLRLSNKDKRWATERILRQPQWQSCTDRSIAEHLGVDHKTVAKVRRDLESNGEIPHCSERKAQDGRRMPAHPQPPAESAEPTDAVAAECQPPAEAVDPPDAMKARNATEIALPWLEALEQAITQANSSRKAIGKLHPQNRQDLAARLLKLSQQLNELARCIQLTLLPGKPKKAA